MKNKLLKRVIGFMDERDEYQLQEINKDLAFSGMILWILMMLLMLISLILDVIHDTFTFITAALLVVNMVYAIMVFSKVRRKGLDNTDCANVEEYEMKKQQVQKGAVRAGIFFTIAMIIFTGFVTPSLTAGKIELDWFSALTFIVLGPLYGVGIYLVGKSKLEKNF